MKRCIGGFKMAETVFVDTTFLVARFNTRDRNHRHAVDFLESQRRSPGAPRPVLSDYVFDEMVTTLLFRSRRHAVARAAGKAILESQASRSSAWTIRRSKLPGTCSSPGRTRIGPSRTASPSF